MGNYATLAMQAAGTGAQIAGTLQQASAAKNAARFNQRVNALRTAEEVERIISNQRRQKATNVTRVAKSGVRLSGSPLSVMAENEFRAERQRLRVQQSGAMTDSLLRMRGRSARTAGRYGVASVALEGAGRIGALAVKNGS